MRLSLAFALTLSVSLHAASVTSKLPVARPASELGFPATSPAPVANPFLQFFPGTVEQFPEEECADSETCRALLEPGDDRDKDKEKEEKADLSVVLNGNGTCTNNFFGNPTAKDIKDHVTFDELIGKPKVEKYIYSCHMPDLSYGGMRIISSNAPDKVVLGDVKKVQDLINEFVKKGVVLKVKIYGYSYGGFEAIQLALALLDAKIVTMKVVHLTTSDPIDKACELKTLGKEPCTTFPATFKAEELANIPNWLNWYQKSSTQIHSDEAPKGASAKNEHLFKKDAENPMKTHTKMMAVDKIFEAFLAN